MPTTAPAEPSPAQTPLVPPPGTQPEAAAPGPVAIPAATPAAETLPLPPEPFADELPPDFWGDALEPPPLSLTASEPLDPRAGAPSVPAPSAPDELTAAPSPLQSAAKPLEGSLQKDPRFLLLQELFPGRISDWQRAEPVANSSEGDENGADGVNDAPDDPETVDLEEGLDADETVS